MRNIYLVFIVVFTFNVSFAQNEITKSEKFNCKMKINPMQTEMSAGQKRSYNFIECYGALFQINYNPSQVICVVKFAKNTLEIEASEDLKIKTNNTILEDVLKLNNRIYAVLSYVSKGTTYLVYREIHEDGTIGEESIIEKIAEELKGDVYISGPLLTTNFDFFTVKYSKDSTKVTFFAKVMNNKKKKNQEYAFVVIDEDFNILNSEILSSKNNEISPYNSDVLLLSSGNIYMLAKSKESTALELFEVNFISKLIEKQETELSDFNIYRANFIEFEGSIVIAGLSKAEEGSSLVDRCFVIELTPSLDVIDSEEFSFRDDISYVLGGEKDLNNDITKYGSLELFINEMGEITLIYEPKKTIVTEVTMDKLQYSEYSYLRYGILMIDFKDNKFKNGLYFNRESYGVYGDNVNTFCYSKNIKDGHFVLYGKSKVSIFDLDNKGEIKNTKVLDMEKSTFENKDFMEMYTDGQSLYLSSKMNIYGWKFKD